MSLVRCVADLGTGPITGSDALLRWGYAERGRLLPGDFVAALEESGPIVRVDDPGRVTP